MSIQYKYNEDNLILEIVNYINKTYAQHYSQNNFQATEFIIDSGHGEGFCIGNILKYAQRYGKKNGYNRKDLLKVVQPTELRWLVSPRSPGRPLSPKSQQHYPYP